MIGAFQKSTGKPIIGVVNQPFSKSKVKAHWGAQFGEKFWTSNSVTNKIERTKPRLLIGSSENKDLVFKLSEIFEIVKAGGAGHKLLMIALGFADVYINTGPSTFKWDTCGPHAILSALGGGVVDCRQFQDIRYDVGEDVSKANAEGIIVFKEKKYLEIIKRDISSL